MELRVGKGFHEPRTFWNSFLVGSILVGPVRECLLKAIWFEQVKVSKTMNAHVEYNA